MSQYYVYIMGNRWGTLYIGVTNDLVRRVYEHKNGVFKGFTSKYKVNLLLHFATTSSPTTAIAREKELKGWVRKKKLALIKAANGLLVRRLRRPKPGAHSPQASLHDPSPELRSGSG